MFDTAGQEQLKALRHHAYDLIPVLDPVLRVVSCRYDETNVFLVAYDMTDQASLEVCEPPLSSLRHLKPSTGF